MTPTNLESRLATLRRRLSLVLWLYGISWVVAVVFGAALAAGVLDWLFRWDDPGVRLIAGLAILAGGAWVAWRFLVGPLLVQLSDVDLAVRIERRFPALKDSLASSVQFLSANGDPRLGSPQLQRHVVEATLGEMDRLDFVHCLSTRTVRRVVCAAVAVCLAVATIVGFNQAAAAIALRRMVFPFSGPAWPRRVELQMLNAQFQALDRDAAEALRIARGETLELFVENVQGPLPDDLAVYFDLGEGQIVEERVRRTTMRGPDQSQRQAREVGAVSLVGTKGPLRFRAVGGDDRDMPWHLLDVVPPPVVEQLQVKVIPPAYSARPPELLPAGVGHVRGLLGTRVEIAAKVNKPLSSARLRMKGGRPQPMDLADDGRAFNTSFEIAEPGIYSYWFALKDRQDFEQSDPPRYEIRGIADLAPDVYIDRPSEDMLVTAEAEIPVRVIAKDDLGLNEMRLRFQLGESVETAGMEIALRDGDAAGERPQQLSLDYLWRLAALPLAEGMQVLYHAEATDHFDLGPEHVGRSITRSLTVVSAAEKESELASRQAGLLDELERILDRQRQARQHVGELLLQLEKVGRLRPEDVDLLKRVELDQRQIASRLLNPVDGVEVQTQRLLDELDQNRLDAPQTRSRLGQIATELALLSADALPAIEQELTLARKMIQMRAARERESQDNDSSAAADAAAKPPLSQTHEQQAAVVDSLETVVGLLSRWRHASDLHAELSDLVSGQRDVADATAQTAARTQGRPLSSLSPQEQAELAKLAERQRQRAEQLQKFRQRLDNVAEEMTATQRDETETLSDAADHLDRQLTTGTMRDAAQQLERNRTGEAATLQNQALQDLQELQDILRQEGESDTGQLVKKLREAEQELESLHNRQDELLHKVEQLRSQPQTEERLQQLKRLADEQQQLRDDVLRLSRRIGRLQADQAAETLRRSSDRMRQAAEQLQQDDPSSAPPEQREALDDLEQARRELAQRRREAEEQLARELMERIADELKGMIARQQQVIDETVRLEGERQRRGNWSRGQLKSLRDLVDVQLGLKGETDNLVATLEAAEVFALALRGAARSMQQAADRLAERLTDAETVAREQAARKRFVDLIAALEPPKDQSPPGTSPGETTGAGTGGPQTDGIPPLAQLRMLKTLQEDVHRRTLELDGLRDQGGNLTPERQTEVEQLAAEQGQLADLARNLMQQTLAPFETDAQPAPRPQTPLDDTETP